MDREAFAEFLDADTVFLDGLDDAIIGTGESYGNTEHIVAYSYKRLVDIFMQRDGMSYEHACEWIDCNILCLHAGKYTPFVVLDIDFY